METFFDGKETSVLTDDVVANQVMGQRFLETIDREVVVVSDGREAVRKRTV